LRACSKETLVGGGGGGEEEERKGFLEEVIFQTQKMMGQTQVVFQAYE
jgi:hypothetical protein